MKGVLVGLLFIVGGVLIIYFNKQLYRTFGNIEWAEKWLGDSRAIYPLAGAGLIVVGVLFMFGVGTGNPTDIDATLTGE